MLWWQLQVASLTLPVTNATVVDDYIYIVRLQHLRNCGKHNIHEVRLYFWDLQ